MAKHARLSLIFDSETKAVDICFVHSLNGPSFSTWTAKSGTFWPRDILPKDVPHCRIFTCGYKISPLLTSVSTIATLATLATLANTFLEELVESRHQSHEASLFPNIDMHI